MSKKIYTLLLLFIALVAASCSDSLGVVDPDSPGALTISLRSSSLDIASRADANNEFYIGKTYFFFYTSESEDVEPVLSRTADVNAYNSRSITFGLDGDDLVTLFGDSGTTCYVYAISNLPDDVTIDDKPTIKSLKSIHLSSDFTDFENVPRFVMDGTGTITLNRETSTMSGNIWLKRAAAKVYLRVSMMNSLMLPDDDELFLEYEPVVGDGFKATLYNAPTEGLVDGTLDDPKLVDYSRTYSFELTSGTSASNKKKFYKHDYFYLYPCSWDESSDRVVHVLVAVPWKVTGFLTGNVTYKTYYYQLAIDFDNNQIRRNYNYYMSLFVSPVGGTLDGEVIEPDEKSFSFQIADWTNDGATITAEINRNHYLMVQDNSFELFAQSDLSVEFQTCSDVTAYLTEVKYESTLYNKYIYLYKTKYDSDSRSYKEVQKGDADYYSDDDLTVHTSYSTAVNYIKNDQKNFIVSSDNTMLQIEYSTEDGVDTGAGTLKFYSNVDKTAGLIYRPIYYTIVLINNADHGTSSQTIAITQYPAKYVEYGDGGDVFVNGYYARLASGDVDNYNYTTNSQAETYSQGSKTGYFASYAFTYENYNADGGYYYSTDYLPYGVSSNSVATSYGSQSKDYVVYGKSAVNSSYEYVRGVLTDDINFENTVDVVVSAFSSNSDKNFVVQDRNNSSAEVTYEYAIGDPRVGGGFITDSQHKVGSYDRTDYVLYDYYDHGEQSGSQYRRYVTPWGDLAGKIKIGGFSTKFDNVIAPRYKIASSYGAVNVTHSFDVAQKRCATYQEAGYPAGRWRLPTLAEVSFVVNLQHLGVIDDMFDDSGKRAYWVCSGGWFQPIESGSSLDNGALGVYKSGAYTSTSKDGHYLSRCVYDLWYWGDTQQDKTKFHAMPTK